MVSSGLLILIAHIWIVLCFGSALGVLIHSVGKPQRMWIMNVVWPVTALYMGPVAVHLYLKTLPVLSRTDSPPQMHGSQERNKHDAPTMLQNSIAVFHCGAGCSIGDLIAELIVPAMGLAFAGKFGSRLIVDFVFAFILGIAFQYFTIAPMRDLSVGEGLKVALRADTISIGLFEVGMFAWMTIVHFWLFPSRTLGPNSALFWFMMQVAMVVGFFTALPANSWLIRKGWKEKMPQVDPRALSTKATQAQANQRRPAA